MNVALQSTLPFPPTHSPFTVTVRTRSSLSLCPVSSTSLVPTASHLSASSPRATKVSRRRKVLRRRRMTMKMIFLTSLRARTSRARLSKRHCLQNKGLCRLGEKRDRREEENEELINHYERLLRMLLMLIVSNRARS